MKGGLLALLGGSFGQLRFATFWPEITEKSCVRNECCIKGCACLGEQDAVDSSVDRNPNKLQDSV